MKKERKENTGKAMLAVEIDSDLMEALKGMAGKRGLKVAPFVRMLLIECREADSDYRSDKRA